KFLAVEKMDNGKGDIWLVDLLRGAPSRFTFDPADDRVPFFSPDGKFVAFNSNRSGTVDVYTKAVTGLGAEELVQKGPSDGAGDWSPDAKVMLYVASSDIWELPMTGGRKPRLIIQDRGNQRYPRFSPDGRWIVYGSNETGRYEVYVQAFPPSGGKWQIS